MTKFSLAYAIVPIVLLLIALGIYLAGYTSIEGYPLLSGDNFALGYLAAGQFSVGVFAAGTFAVGIFAAGIFAIRILWLLIKLALAAELLLQSPQSPSKRCCLRK